MRKVIVTYQMTRKTEDGRETAETCITLPMSDENAEELLTDGEESTAYLVSVYDILENLSQLQEYDYVGFWRAELAAKDSAVGYEEPKPRYRVTWCDLEGNAHEVSYSDLEDATAELRYLEDCSTQGPVRLEEIKPDTVK